MKKVFNIVFLILFALTPAITSAQVTVNIIGECDTANGTYSYLDLYNGKNRYSLDIISGGLPVNLQVRFDGINWVIWANVAPTESGFYNPNVTSSIFPPEIGWIGDACTTGSMTISVVLSNSNANLSEKFNIKNPVENYLDLKVKNSDLQFEKVEICNLLGKIVKSEQYSYEKIDVSNLESGIYILKITDFNNKVYSGKLIKK